MLNTKRMLAVLLSLELFIAPFGAPVLAGTCDNIKGNGNVPEQKIHYCMAAKDARHSSDAQFSLSLVWLVVAAVCTAACVDVFQTSLAACNIANYSGMAVDLIMTIKADDFMSQALQNVGMTLISEAATAYLTGASLSAFGSTVTDGGSGLLTDGGEGASCFLAGFAGLRTGLKMFQSSQSKDTAKENERMAAQFNSQQTAVGVSQVTISAAPGDGTMVPPAASSFGITTAGGGSAGGSGTANSCGSQIVDGNTGGFLECAAALDGALPPGIKDKAFADKFKELTKMDLGDFLKKASEEGTSPAKALGGLASGGKKTDEVAGKLEAAYAKLDMGSFSDKMSSTYASSGGGGGSKSGGGANISSLFGAGRATASAGSNQSTGLEKFGKSYDEIFNNRGLSLFKRVEQKYSQIRTRVKELPFSSQYNQISLQNKR